MAHSRKVATRVVSEVAKELATKLREELKKLGLRAGERLGVAVSGGADSVALLRLMLELRESLGIVVCVVHFNHGLRGKASDADEQFVAKLAKSHKLEVFVAREDIGAKAKRERSNLEDAGRRARVAFFDELVKNGRVSRVAVAHTADDQAETVLAHILRGTGLAGLAGIHAESGVVIRPLLKVRRGDLRVYLRTKRQTWREDKSNKDTERTRARIRHELMPLLEKRFQCATVEHLCQLAELAREDELYLEGQAHAWEKAYVQFTERSAAQLPLLEFSEQTRAIKTRAIRRIVERIKTHAGQLSSLHVEAVLELAEAKESGKSIPVPGGVEVLRDRSVLLFRRQASNERKDKRGEAGYAYEVHLGGSGTELRLMEHECCLHFRVIDWPAQGRETKDTGPVTQVLLDRERLRSPLIVRNWQPGDSMQPVGHQKRHTLARLWNEAGLNRWEKAVAPVLTSNGKVVWALGLKVAAEFAVNEETRSGVVITLEQKS
jgi:tRNA(Ile)-lysidine synthase